jgi:hypothetical protein
VSVRKKRLSVSVSVFGGLAPLVATWLIAQTGDPLSPSYYLIVTALLSLFALVAIQRRQTLARGLTEGFEMQKQLV